VLFLKLARKKNFLKEKQILIKNFLRKIIEKIKNHLYKFLRALAISKYFCFLNKNHFIKKFVFNNFYYKKKYSFIISF